MKSPILKMREQVINSGLYLALVDIFKAHRLWVNFGFAFASLVVAHNSFAVPILSSPRQLASDQVEVGGLGLFAEWTHLDKLSFEHRANSLYNVDQLFSLRQLQSVPVVQARAGDGAENKGKERKQPGVRPDKNINFIEHYPGLSLIAFNFLIGVSVPLIFGFALHAWKHGINNAWRDLVFTWPVPYWMRFVPKDEQGLP